MKKLTGGGGEKVGRRYGFLECSAWSKAVDAKQWKQCGGSKAQEAKRKEESDGSKVEEGKMRTVDGVFRGLPKFGEHGLQVLAGNHDFENHPPK